MQSENRINIVFGFWVLRFDFVIILLLYYIIFQFISLTPLSQTLGTLGANLGAGVPFCGGCSTRNNFNISPA